MPEQRKALVVDDEKQTLMLAARWLEAARYSVFTADNFADARATLDEVKPDLLVVDVRLHEFNGIQLALRARELRPEARILIVSGWDDEVLRREALACDAVFLSKPLTSAALLAAADTDSAPPSLWSRPRQS
jgi:DNA-binding response OmpR family regulator